MSKSEQTRPVKGKQAAFLSAYEKVWSVRGASEAAKVDRNSHYYWLRTDENYVKVWQEVQEKAADELEEEAVRRAKANSDVLLIFLLKGARPEKYRERTEVKVPGLDQLAERLARAAQRIT